MWGQTMNTRLIDNFKTEMIEELSIFKYAYKNSQYAHHQIENMEKILNDENMTNSNKWDAINTIANKMPGYFAFWSSIRPLTLSIQSILSKYSKEALANDEITQLKSQILNYQIEVAQLKGLDDSSQIDKEKLQRKIAEFQTKNAELIKENMALKEENNSLTHQISTLTVLYQKSQVDIENMNKNMDRLNEDLTQYKVGLKIRDDRINNLEDQFKKFSNLVNSQNNQVQQVAQEQQSQQVAQEIGNNLEKSAKNQQEIMNSPKKIISTPESKRRPINSQLSSTIITDSNNSTNKTSFNHYKLFSTKKKDDQSKESDYSHLSQVPGYLYLH